MYNVKIEKKQIMINGFNYKNQYKFQLTLEQSYFTKKKPKQKVKLYMVPEWFIYNYGIEGVDW